MVPRTLLTTLVAGVALAAPGGAAADVVTDWNRTLVDVLYATHTAPQPGTRIGAIVQTSVYDAVNGIRRKYTQFHPELVTAPAPRGASAPAAAIGAAYTALVALFPTQKPVFDGQLVASLATLTDDEDDDGGGTSRAVTRGLAWGETIANAILAWRAADGLSTPLPAWTPLALPSWQPTPPAFATPVFRQFATMTPWSLTTPSQFLPPPPPALASARYAQDFDEVKTIGSAATANADDVATARFWNGRFDTVATMWNRAAESLAATRRASLVENARFFALLDASMADAVIAVWNAKNAYNTWRPITAITNADADGNDATVADPRWTPVLTTPAHQEYPSGHSGVSSAAATVFAAFFPGAPITVRSDGIAETVDADGASRSSRTYASTATMLDEVAFARIAGGIHFRFACDAARQMGSSVAAFTLATQMLRLHGEDGD